MKTPQQFKVERGIPIPPVKMGLTAALRKLQVNESVLVNGKSTNQCSKIIACLKLKESGDFVSRTVEGGTRIWRVKPATLP